MYCAVVVSLLIFIGGIYLGVSRYGEGSWYSGLGAVGLLVVTALIGYGVFKCVTWRCDRHGTKYKTPIQRS